MLRMTVDASDHATDTPSPPGLHLPPPTLRRELRTFAGRTQEDVAAEFGVTDGAISYWERHRPGRRHMRRYVLLLLDWATSAQNSGVPVGWPFRHAGDPER